jgi:hypothetical protein
MVITNSYNHGYNHANTSAREYSVSGRGPHIYINIHNSNYEYLRNGYNQQL